MKNYKKFDLQKALAGDKVVTRDGREVTEIHRFNTVIDRKNIISVIDGDFRCHYDNGNYFDDSTKSCNDLFMTTTKKSAWLNIYRFNKTLVSSLYDTEEEANKRADSDRLACIQVEWEE